MASMPSSSSSSSSLSSSSSSEETVVPTPAATAATVYSKASENVCMWQQQSSDACDSPRSCYDCLNSSPSDDVECVISSAGLCTTMADYVWQEDYRINSSEVVTHYFPSTNTTYCESSDSVCTSCKASQFVKSASGSVEPSQFCVGSGGCVCVGFCESPVYSTKVSSAYCSTLSSTTTVNVMGISVGDIVTIIILCFTIPVIAYLWWVRRLHQRRLVREDAYRNRAPVNGPLLPLVGWKKYCADLMANQTAIVGVVTNDAEVATPTAAVEEPGGQESEASAHDGINPSAPLSNLQIATLSIEFEDPQHPLTAVTSTGRRRSSIDNINVVRLRPSLPIISSNERDSDEDEDDETDAPYAPLEERTA